MQEHHTPYQLVNNCKKKGKTKINYFPLCLTEKYHLIEYLNDICLLNKEVNLSMHVDIKVNCYLEP